MARQENFFALLSDEEGDDDYSAVVSRVAAKVEAEKEKKKKKEEEEQRKKDQSQSLTAGPDFTSQPLPPTEYVRSETARGRGSSRGSGKFVRNDMEQFENRRPNGYRRNYGEVNGYQGNNGMSDGYRQSNDGADVYRRNSRGADGYQQNYRTANGYQRNYGVDSAGNGGAEGYRRNYGGVDGYQQNYGGASAGNAVDGNWEGQGRGRGRGGVGGRGRGRGRGKGSQYVEGNQQLDENQQQEGGSEKATESHSFRDERQLRNGNWSNGDERRVNGGGNRGFRAQEGRPFNGHDGRKTGIRELNNGSETKEETFGDNGGHAINGDDNSGTDNRNALPTTEVLKDAEDNKDKLDEASQQEYNRKKAQEREERKKAEEREEERKKKAAQEREEERKKMTLVQYERLLLEKRSTLEALKTEERKVTLDKDFESMQLVDNKKSEESLFIKLKSEKDKIKKKDSFDKGEKARKVKTQHILLGEMPRWPRGHEERFGGRGGYSDSTSGGGRGRGHEERNGGRGGYSPSRAADSTTGGGRDGNKGEEYSRRQGVVPSVEDPGQFPDLGKAVKA